MKPRNRAFGLILVIGLLSTMLFGGAATSAQQSSFATPILVVNTSFLNVRTGPGVEYSILVTVVGGTELPVLGVAEDRVWYQVATDGGPGWVNVSFTLPRGDFTNVPLVEPGEVGAPNFGADAGQGGGALPVTSVSGERVTGYSLIGRDLRAAPSFDSLILSRSVPNDPNTIYPLLGFTTGDDGSTWYQVNVPGVGIGWTDTVELRPLECGVEVGVVVERQPINFDGIANRDPFLLEVGTEVYILGFAGTNNEFWRVELLDGTVGFVTLSGVTQRSDDIVSICDGVTGSVASDPGQGGGATTSDPGFTPPTLATNRVIVNTGNLNIRSGPSAGFSIVATVPGGTELAVLGRAPDNVWYLVEGAFGQGWLNSQFTIFRGVFSTVPVVEANTVVTSTAAQAGQGGAVSTTSVSSGRQVTGVSLLGKDLHEAPSYDSLILSRSVPNDPNTILPLLGATEDADGNTWYLVNVPSIGLGWMDAVEFRALECGTDQVGIIVRETPITFDGIANRDSFLLPVNTEGYLVGIRGDFVLFELLDGTVGLVNRAAFDNRPDEVVSICTDLPGVTTSAATTGTTVTDTTAPSTQPTVSGNRVVVNTGNLNIRSGPSAAFSVVATVPGGTELAVAGRSADGVWYFVEGSFGQGWVNSQFVLFRGAYNSVPVVGN